MPGQTWTDKEEEFYEDNARLSLTIDEAIKVAVKEGFGERTFDEVARYFAFRKKPWGILAGQQNLGGHYR